MKKNLRKLPFKGKFGILLAVLCCAFIYLLYVRINAVNTGSGAGTAAGIASGKLIGSIEGLSEAREAYADGVAQGLSNEDTTAKMGNAIKKVERLEVMVASVKLMDMHKLGANTEYAALYLLKGDAVFSVDLALTDFEERDGDIYITIPNPKMELIIDQSKIEKVAEYQKHFFSGSAEKGFDDYINMMKKIAEETPETLTNYDVLMQSAKSSAEKQVKALAEAVMLEKKNIYVGFKESEGE